ncbi:hypothetical protein HK101_002289 [Irineochytrium annulatum]|nr:hypothetical protein HK101_002289 [Irineochytrium annulatum]
MQRVSNIPIVRESINSVSYAYEATKNVSYVVKYSAETVETGVKTISKPVLNTLEPALKPLDRFACNQLDRLERNFPSMLSASPPTTQKALPAPPGSMDMDMDNQQRRNRTMSISSVDLLSPPPVPLSDYSLSNHNAPATSSSSSSLNPGNGANSSSSALIGPVTTAPHIDRKPRSRWHQVVSGVGANLGAMVISDDTMRGLKYCLQWLEYATNHIDRQIALLRDFLLRATGSMTARIMGPQSAEGVAGPSSASVTTPVTASTLTPPLSPVGPPGADGNNLAASSSRAPENLAVSSHVFDLPSALLAIRREIVETLRRVVDVLGRYAAVYLPPPARRTVREFILSLPSRWATLQTQAPNGPAVPGAAAASSATTPQKPVVPPLNNASSTATLNGGESATAGPANAATAASDPSTPPEAQRVLTLATESSNMLKGVMNVFSQTVDGAEMVLGRVVHPHPFSFEDQPGAGVGSSSSAPLNPNASSPLDPTAPYSLNGDAAATPMGQRSRRHSGSSTLSSTSGGFPPAFRPGREMTAGSSVIGRSSRGSSIGSEGGGQHVAPAGPCACPACVGGVGAGFERMVRTPVPQQLQQQQPGPGYAAGMETEEERAARGSSPEGMDVDEG